jgi:hypothetical protein
MTESSRLDITIASDFAAVIDGNGATMNTGGRISIGFAILVLGGAGSVCAQDAPSLAAKPVTSAARPHARSAAANAQRRSHLVGTTDIGPPSATTGYLAVYNAQAQALAHGSSAQIPRSSSWTQEPQVLVRTARVVAQPVRRDYFPGMRRHCTPSRAAVLTGGGSHR